MGRSELAWLRLTPSQGFPDLKSKIESSKEKEKEKAQINVRKG